MSEKSTDEKKIDEIVNIHIDVLKDLLIGKPFEKIKEENSEEFERLEYIEIVKKTRLLTFNENNQLIGAYPISPIETDYKVTVEGIGTGYSMCAVDALGVAYTFNKTTTIQSIDKSTGDSIDIMIDPDFPNKNSGYYVSYNKISCSKENRPDMVSATDICPTIDFYSNIDSIQDNDIDFLSFEQALESAKYQFTPEALKKCVESRSPKFLALQDQDIPLL